MQQKLENRVIIKIGYYYLNELMWGCLNRLMTVPDRQAGSPALMQAMDRINRRFPKGIAVAAAGFDKAWQSKVERLSPRYTTDWRELLRVKCD